MRSTALILRNYELGLCFSTGADADRCFQNSRNSKVGLNISDVDVKTSTVNFYSEKLSVINLLPEWSEIHPSFLRIHGF